MIDRIGCDHLVEPTGFAGFPELKDPPCSNLVLLRHVHP
jgi:hypothetical protein